MILTFGGIAGSILLNALLFQNARHPAPIASAPETSQTPRSVERRAETPVATPTAPVSPDGPAAVPTSAPMPPARPTDFSQPVRETQIRPPAAVTNVPRTAAAPAAPAPAARAAAPRDPIADLINGGDLRPPADIRGARSASARREN